MGLNLPPELAGRYRGKEYIARMPFLLNSYLDSDPVIDRMVARPVGEKDVFLGIAGFHALDMIANAGADTQQHYQKAVLFDVNTTQVKAMNATLHLIAHAKNADDFIESFAPQYAQWINEMPRIGKKHQTEEDRNYFATHGRAAQPRNAQEIRDQLHFDRCNPNSWLFPDNFERIKAMAQRHDIDTAIMDLQDDKRVGMLKDWLTKSGLRVGDAYLSSSLLFMEPRRAFDYYGRPKNDANKFVENLLSLTDEKSGILFSQQVPENTGSKPFTLARAVPAAFRDMLEEWKQDHTTPEDMRYQYLFQMGDRAYQIARVTDEHTNGHGIVLEVTPESGDFQLGEEEAVTRALTRGRFNVIHNGHSDSVRFAVKPDDLETPRFFTNIAAALREALPALHDGWSRPF